MPNRLSNWFENQKQTQTFHPSWILLGVAATLIIAGIVWIPAELVSKAEYERLPAAYAVPVPGKNAAQTGETPAAVEQLPLPARSGPKTIRVDFSPPDVDDLPSGEFGEAVLLGRNIFNDTQTYARTCVGNGLNCVNCHLDEGRKANSAPLWAAYGMFPAYREKNSRVNSYEDRLTGCFRFSMNGKAPPPGSKELIALVGYSYWLSKGAPVGNDSFNTGAGMTQIHNAAAFIRANMPLGQGNTLTEQEAWDVAKYMNSHSRPADPRVTQS